MASRRDLRHKLRRRSIVDAAAEVFAEAGTDAATLEQIGARVGLSKASLYYYVDSKEQLVADVLAAVLDDIDARAAQLTGPGPSPGPGAGPGPDPLAQLKLRARAHVETAVHSPAGRLIIGNLDALAGNKAAVPLLRRCEEPARQLLQRARDRGLTRAIDIVCAVKLLYGGLNNIPRWYGPEYGPLEVVIERTWEIFISGVRTAR